VIRNCGSVPYLHLSCNHPVALVRWVSVHPHGPIHPNVIQVSGLETVICVCTCHEIGTNILFNTSTLVLGIVLHPGPVMVLMAMVVYRPCVVLASVSST
jgi:hypothetical protein